MRSFRTSIASFVLGIASAVIACVFDSTPALFTGFMIASLVFGAVFVATVGKGYDAEIEDTHRENISGSSHAHMSKAA
ncbi:hypothetical protein [Mobilibacterium timonense]|uniref:hypothetical protein n=1 Tax=Mobilibacterium timonense TaxID=1871012 RepID=UPI003A91FC92